MQKHLSKVPAHDSDGYLTAVSALRGLYDVGEHRVAVGENELARPQRVKDIPQAL